VRSREVQQRSDHRRRRFKYIDNKFEIFFSKKTIKDSLIIKIPLNIPEFEVGGMFFELSPKFYQNPQDFKFFISNKKSAVNSLKSKLQTDLDPSRTILTIKYSSRDPELTAKVVNTIANLFVDKILEMKRFKTSSILKTFGEQLIVAQKNLQEAETKLEEYRKTHPFLNLSSDLTQQVQQFSDLEFELKKSRNSLKQLKEIVSNDQRNPTEKSILKKEILSFLRSENVPSADVLLIDYNSLLTQEETLLSTFPESHPQVIEIRKKLSDLEKRIENLLVQYRDELESRIKNNQEEMRSLESKLRQLPGQETILAKLIRDKDVKEKIYSDILIKYNEARVADAAIIPDAYLLDTAMIPEQTNSKLIQYLILIFGLILSFGIAIGTIVLWDFFNPAIKDESDLKYDVDIPVIGTIPVIGKDEEIPKVWDPKEKYKIDPKLITSDYAPNIIGEKYRTIRTHILFQNGGEKSLHSLLVTSLNANEGKSLNVSNIAITIAQQKLLTVLVDVDLRRGVLHHSFVCEKKPGLTDLLNSRVEISKENIQKILQKTHVPNLYLIASGSPVPNPSELIGSQRMRKFVEVLENSFDFVLFDSPPLIVAADAVILSRVVNKILFVVKAGITKKKQLINTIEQFETLKEKSLGIILNGVPLNIKKSKYNYTYYQY